jgi:hypothetical protein
MGFNIREGLRLTGRSARVGMPTADSSLSHQAE